MCRDWHREVKRVCRRNLWGVDSDKSVQNLAFIRQQSLHLYSIREFPEIVVLSVVESDRVRVVLGELATIQALLKSRQTVKSTSEVTGEYQDDSGLHGSAVQRGSQVIPEPTHASVFRVIDGVIRIVWVHTAGAQRPVEPRFVRWKRKRRSWII